MSDSHEISTDSAEPAESRPPLLDRALRLLDFLIRFQQQRVSPVRRIDNYISQSGKVVWLHSVPDHPAVACALDVEEPAPRAPFLIVNRVPKVEPPQIPEDLIPWIEIDNIRDPAEDPTVAETITETHEDENGFLTTITRHIENEPNIRDESSMWLELWNDWAHATLVDEPVRKLYGALFQISEQAAAFPEEFELIGAVGCLSWRPEEHAEVQRHLLTIPLQVMLNDSNGQLTVQAADNDESPTIELEMLESTLWPKPERLNDIKDQATSLENHLLGKEHTGTLLTRIINNIDPDGRYDDSLQPGEIRNDPVVTFAPAIILRRRSKLSILRIFQEIEKQLKDSEQVPEGFRQLLEVVELSDREEPGQHRSKSIGETYLPLEANDQQKEIVRRADIRKHTIVQGPPGTGKTHTIANLISHLLAEGKRVLVTAHTDRALRELRDKLPRELESLCVSVVGRDRSDLADLKVAVETLARRTAEYDAKQAETELKQFEAKLDELRRDRSSLYHKLLESREKETLVTKHGPYEGTLAQISQNHAAHSQQYNWLSEYDLVDSEGPPLMDAEALKWLELIDAKNSEEDERQAKCDLIQITSIPKPDEFEKLVNRTLETEAVVAGNDETNLQPMLDMVSALTKEEKAGLDRRVSNLATTSNELRTRKESWMEAALGDVFSGKPELWQQRYAEINNQLARCKETLDLMNPAVTIEIDSSSLDGLVAQASALAHFLEEGGRFDRFITPKPVRMARAFTGQVRIDGVAPTTKESVSLFLSWAEAKRLLDYVERLWPEGTPIPSEDTLLERWAWNYAESVQLRRVVEFSEAIQKENKTLADIGIPTVNWAQEEDVRLLTEAISVSAKKDAAVEARKPLLDLLEHIDAKSSWPAPDVHLYLGGAVKNDDCRQYQEAFVQLESLWNLRPEITEREELESRLEKSAPGLVADIIGSPEEDWNARLSSFKDAREWVLVGQWLDEESKSDADDLQRQITALEDRIHKTITDLVAARSWSLAVSRLGTAEQQNLKSYALAIRKIGKGTGKYAPHQRKEARNTLKKCRSAVPVWIMPIYRIAETIEVEPDMFDVVIIDEASQAGVEASFLQYLAPRIVVVGDDKQVSPSGVGLNQQNLIDLRKHLLFDMDHGHVWENPTASFFDLARIRYGDVITLREHFRCVPEIIEFSNRIAYEPDRVPLIPLRQYGVDRLEPVMPVFVDDGYVKGSSGNMVNPPEAQRIVDTILTCCASHAYESKTMGVISLTGSSQADLIEQEIIGRMDPKEYRQREFRCGDSADFQGSERDVMFLSMVVAPEDGRRIQPLVRENFVQRFNVAASRAKDQMWVFHSIRLEELTNHEDMRFQLLDYCYAAQQLQSIELESVVKPDDIIVTPFDSLFEQQIYNQIVKRGYTVVPQWEVYGYRIDLVVIGAQSRLGVECDGDQWHGADKYEQDMSRQRELERCGWSFFRIRASAFYRDPHEALEKLWRMLDDHEIYPTSRLETTKTKISPTVTQVGTMPRQVIESSPAPVPHIQTAQEVLAEESESRPDTTVEEDAWLYETSRDHWPESQSESPSTSRDVTKEESWSNESRPDRNIETQNKPTSDKKNASHHGKPETISRPDAERVQPREGISHKNVDVQDHVLDAEAYRDSDIIDVPLALIPLQIATIVNEKGQVPLGDIRDVLEQRYGISWTHFSDRWLHRFAWSSVGHKFVKWDESETILMPGTRQPAVVESLGTWTYSDIRRLADRVFESGKIGDELYSEVINTVSDGKRAPRLIGRLVGLAVWEAQNTSARLFE